MKLSQKVILGLAIVAAAGIIVYITKKRADTKLMLAQIADEGYETANDVLFPGKKIQAKHLRYGPVIPDQDI
ncbi:MAG: hypothetical protein ABI707_09770 [Ferruginibacter sp.]